MRFSNRWEDYALLDATEGKRLERWGDIILIRPDPQVVWNTPKRSPLWKDAHAEYHRSNKGGGSWETFKKIPESWQVEYPLKESTSCKELNSLQGVRKLKFNLKPMGFKHTGLFPEQAVNWDFLSELIAPKAKSGEEVKVLNLFGYTGAATLACAAAGGTATHVDASKGMVAWGKENAADSSLSDRPLRWLVDDCMKFVMREQRRGNKYHGIIMDPPSYGRGPGGEVWKLEDSIFSLVEECGKLLADDSLFFAINSYTAGLSPSVMEYILGVVVKEKLGGEIISDEIGLKVESTGLVLPCGATAIWKI